MTTSRCPKCRATAVYDRSTWIDYHYEPLFTCTRCHRYFRQLWVAKLYEVKSEYEQKRRRKD